MPSRHTQGFSLVEFMLAVVLMAVVASQLLLVFSTQHKSFTEQERVTETQQDVRLLMDVILGDLRMGGFMVNRETGVGGVDGGIADSDILCASDPSVFDPAEYDNATDRFESAEVTTNLTGNNGSVALVDLDVDSDGTADFAAGGGILISDGTSTHCAVIDTVVGTTVSFTPSTLAGQVMAPISTFAAPAVVYVHSGTTLQRNGTTLSTSIDDLQLELGVDLDSDGEIEPADGEFPIDSNNLFDTSLTHIARVYLTGRTVTPDLDFTGQYPAAANRNAGATDNFRRRRIIADAHLRNMR